MMSSSLVVSMREKVTLFTFGPAQGRIPRDNKHRTASQKSHNVRDELKMTAGLVAEHPRGPSSGCDTRP